MKTIQKIVIIFLIFIFSFSLIKTAFADDLDRVYRDIESLEQTLDRLIRQIEGREIPETVVEEPTREEARYTIAGIPGGFSFTRTLRRGDRGADVRYLQMVLNADPQTRVAHTGPGSPGNETEYFGALTEAAVRRFQSKYSQEILAPIGITTPSGVVGMRTNAKLNSLIGAEDPTFPTPTPTPTPVPDHYRELLDAIGEISEAIDDIRQRVDDIERGVTRPRNGEEGILEVGTSPDIYGVNVRPNQTRREIAKFDLEAKDSDIVVQRIDLTFPNLSSREISRALDSVSLYHDGDRLGTVELTRTNIRGSDPNHYVRFSGLDIMVREDRWESVVVEVDAANFGSTEAGRNYEVRLARDGVRGIDGAGIIQTNQLSARRIFNLEVRTLADLEVDVSRNTPDERMVTIRKDRLTNDITLAIFEVTAEDDDMELTDIKVEIASDDKSTSDLSNVVARARLYYDGTFVGETTDVKGNTTIINFETDYYKLPKDTTKELEVVVDVYGMDKSGFKEEGFGLRAVLREVHGVDMSDEYVEWEGYRRGEWQYLYTGTPLLTLVDGIYYYVDDNRRDEVTAIFEFDLEAHEEDVYLQKDNVKFALEGFDGAGTELVNYTSDDWHILLRETGNLANSLSTAASPDVIVEFDAIGGRYREDGNYYVVRSGDEATFEIWGNFYTDGNDISRGRRMHIEKIEWGLNKDLGMFIDDTHFDVTPRTERLTY